MTMQFTKVTAVLFGAIALIHLLRATIIPDIVAYLPLWGSGLLAIVLLTLASLHLWFKRNISCTCWSDTAGYSLTIALLLIGGAMHAYRTIATSDVLLAIPIWPSWIATPLACFIAWYNWNKSVA